MNEAQTMTQTSTLAWIWAPNLSMDSPEHKSQHWTRWSRKNAGR